jgi:protease-4
LTKKTKPIVVSMGNYAASGGYYIACNANTILPKQTQLQDQGFWNITNFTPLANKIGNTEQVETHQNAANYSPFVSIDENFKLSLKNIFTWFCVKFARLKH